MTVIVMSTLMSTCVRVKRVLLAGGFVISLTIITAFFSYSSASTSTFQLLLVLIVLLLWLVMMPKFFVKLKGLYCCVIPILLGSWLLLHIEIREVLIYWTIILLIHIQYQTFTLIAVIQIRFLRLRNILRRIILIIWDWCFLRIFWMVFGAMVAPRVSSWWAVLFTFVVFRMIIRLVMMMFLFLMLTLTGAWLIVSSWWRDEWIWNIK